MLIVGTTIAAATVGLAWATRAGPPGPKSA
jgi:hypothetical protein